MLDKLFLESQKSTNTTYEINRYELRQTLIALKDEYGYLSDITCVDYLGFVEAKKTRFALVYIVRSSDFSKTISLKVYLEEPIMESVSDIYKLANWAEREVFDQYGITFMHHPNLKRILNHKEFVGHPLRKDYPITKYQLCHSTDDLMDEMTPLIKSKGYNNSSTLNYLNIGPSHPATHGTIRIFTALEGESIVASVPEIGYLHRGFEKAAECHTYNQIIPYTDRLNYCSAILNNIAFAKSIEEMLGIKAPDRAVFIRVVIGELSRIIDHMVCLAANLVDMGALTNYWYLFNPREAVYDLLSKLTGARLTSAYTRVGGLAHDLYSGFEADLDECIRQIEVGMGDTLSLIEHNRIFHDRTQNVGAISKEDALSFGFSGPNLRACGVAYDMRKNAPYDYYESFDFSMAVGSVGDTYDRMMVRFEEIRQSISIIKQAMRMMPKGDIIIQDHSIALPPKDAVYNNIEGLMNQFKLTFEGVKVPACEHYSAIEGANGELGFYVVSDGSGTPWKVKCRPPCFYAINGLSKLLENHLVADSVIILGSLNIIAGEMDR
jgi:NADH-quinone oxidoreductase subunit C/D